MKNTINIECKVTALSDNFATAIFNLATKRLLNVSRWSRLNDSLLDKLELTDDRGVAINREIHPNDFLKINVDRDGEKYNWVRVEKVNLERNEDTNTETLTVKARPVADPFTDVDSETLPAAGTFRIIKNGLHITAGVYAEMPGNESEYTDLTSTTKTPKRRERTTLGAYKIQWRSLVNGILFNLKEIESLPA